MKQKKVTILKKRKRAQDDGTTTTENQSSPVATGAKRLHLDIVRPILNFSLDIQFQHKRHNADFACVQRIITRYQLGHRQARITHEHERVHDWSKSSPLKDGQIQRRLDFRLPIRLTTAYFVRHGYSLQDIAWTLDCTSPLHVWHLAMTENISIANAAVKACSASADSINYGGKAVATQKLLKLYADSFPDMHPWPSVLQWRLDLPEGATEDICSIELEQGKFPLPFHPARSLEEFQQLESMYQAAVDKGKQSDELYLNKPYLHFDNYVLWNDPPIKIVPLKLGSYKKPYLLMGRVILFDFYNQWHDTTPCMADTRQLVKIANELWCVMDETFYLYPP